MHDQAKGDGPLAGVRVIDLTSVVLGPYATMLLGDLGADVIKVEATTGDTMRQAGTAKAPGLGSIFLRLGRAKRSVVLDLKRPEGLGDLGDLVDGADVLLHNIRRPAAARLGIGYEELAARNPSLVYGIANGFGPDGPYRDRPAYDDVVQAMIGLLSLQERAGNGARYLPTLVVDKTVGLAFAFAVVTALFARERDPERRGQLVEVPMFEFMTTYTLVEHLFDATYDPPAGPSGYARLTTPHRKVYRTADGLLCMLPYEDKHARRFAEAVGRSDWMDDPRFRTRDDRNANLADWMAELDALMVTRPSAEWIELLERAEIPAARVTTVDEVLQDPHLAQVGLFRRVEHPDAGPIVQPGLALRFDRTPGGTPRPAPRLGQHTTEVLTELGYDDARIRALHDAGVAATG